MDEDYISKTLKDILRLPNLAVEILVNLPIPLLIVDSNAMIIFSNREAEFLFGYHHTEFIGQHINILLPESVREVHKTHLEKFFSTPRPRAMGYGMELHARLKNGSEIGIEIELRPIPTPDNLVVMASIRKK